MAKKFKVAGKVITLIRGNNQAIRVGLRNPQMNKIASEGAAKFGVSRGKIFDELRKRELAASGWAGEITGVVAQGTKGKRVFINRSAFSKKRPKFMQDQVNLRKTVNHELFHTLPVVGPSEIGAHFVGGLFSKKKKLSFREGFKEVSRFREIRPREYRKEIKQLQKIGTKALVGVAATAGAAGATAGSVVIYRRVRGRIVPIRVKKGRR